MVWGTLENAPHLFVLPIYLMEYEQRAGENLRKTDVLLQLSVDNRLPCGVEEKNSCIFETGDVYYSHQETQLNPLSSGRGEIPHWR